MTSDIKKKIDEAINIVKDVPEPYQNLSFEVVLGHLLNSTTTTTSKTSHKQSISIVKKEGQTGIETMLKSDYDWASTHIPKLKPIGQNLYVLKIASDDFGIDILSPKDIQIILSQKFRLSKSANAVSMSLMEAVGKDVDRIQEGKEYLYRITNKGREHLDSLIQKLEDEHK
ncbi:MAG: hypothetical protein KGI19_08885 [Thaumarchaeota archaeon]|nr:hypothetical protein [Nitrososphaerota archaeon]